MVSESTQEDTKKHLDLVIRETGLDRNDVLFFVQNQRPVFDCKGKFLLSNEYTISTSPGMCMHVTLHIY